LACHVQPLIREGCTHGGGAFFCPRQKNLKKVGGGKGKKRKGKKGKADEKDLFHNL